MHTDKRGLARQTNGGLAQQAGTSYTRRASRDSSSFELKLSHSQQCAHSPVTVCCVSVCVPLLRAVAPTGRDGVGIIWSYSLLHSVHDTLIKVVNVAYHPVYL